MMTLDLETYERIYNAASNEASVASRKGHDGKGRNNCLFNAIFDRMVAEEIEKRRTRNG